MSGYRILGLVWATELLIASNAVAQTNDDFAYQPMIKDPAKLSLINDLKQKLPNFRAVAPGLWRGGQPHREEILKLKGLGIKTIVSLRSEEGKVDDEKKFVETAGMKFINIPLSAMSEPDTTSVNRFLSILENQSFYPLFVHCLHGRDRTSAMIGIYRIQRGASADQAYSEMLSCGFRPMFHRLSDAVFKYGVKVGRPGTPPKFEDESVSF